MKKMKQCKVCSKEIAVDAKRCPECGGKNKKPIYKRAWFIIIAIFIVIAAASGVNGNKENGSSEKVANNATVETTKDNSTKVKEDTTQKEKSVPTEYKSALKKAKIYSDTMYMSKAGIYGQLTSEYGEKFTQEAAQYAIDNVVADWNKNALEKAKTYQGTMAMSPSAIYDQLTSEYGEKFTPEEAQYAIDNLE